MRRLLAAAIVVPLLAQAPAAQQSVPFDIFLGRVFDFVERFQKDIGSMVAEEKYDQRITSLNAGTRGDVGRTMRSDFLLINVDGHGWTPFRDVYEVDGRQIRDREDRLTKLFLSGTGEGAFEQARRIMNEGARFNLGGTTRNINVPTLPLMYFAPDVRGGVRFVEAKPDRGERVIEFTELAHPTLITTGANRDLPAHGRVWADERTGTITRAEIEAADTTIVSTITVTFGQDEKLGTWVPRRMEDRTKRPNDLSEIRGIATYSRFRRFQVSTSEDVASDQVDKATGDK